VLTCAVFVLHLQLRALEVRATLEDLMYVSILEKFVGLGVEMLPRLDGEWLLAQNCRFFF
jgi:hypothetical protein